MTRYDMTNPTYRSWAAMKRRCNCCTDERWADYGGRGITHDPRWAKFTAFLADMGERPPGTSLDRKDNNKGYYKENCRWATRSQQQRNTRRSVLTETITMRARQLKKDCPEVSDRSLSRQIAAEFGISPNTVREFYKGRYLG